MKDKIVDTKMRWSTCGWFGAQIGSTIWLGMAAASVFGTEYHSSFLILLMCFLVPNVVGIGLWLRRNRTSIYARVQSLITCIGICGIVGLFRLKTAAIRNWYITVVISNWVLLIFVATCVGFLILVRRLHCKAKKSV